MITTEDHEASGLSNLLRPNKCRKGSEDQICTLTGEKYVHASGKLEVLLVLQECGMATGVLNYRSHNKTAQLLPVI